MSYKEDFGNDKGWSAIDVSTRLNSSAGKAFVGFLKANGVDTIVRYYASAPKPKTLTPEEAQFLSHEGFAILPVFQDSSRAIDNFSTALGKKNAQSARAFAKSVGQPAGVGSTILFAVDADYTAAQIDGPILSHFKALHAAIGGAFRIGAYGSGAVLARLLAEGLIEVPWLSMSRAFLGTEQFFYGNTWALRQLPPERTEPTSGIEYDRNVIRIPRKRLGAFQVGADGTGMVAWDEADHAVPATTAGTAGEGTAGKARLALSADTLIVATDGLRLRAAPNAATIRELSIGDRLVDRGEAGVPGWRNVTAGSDDGVCFAHYLRKPGRPEVEALLDGAFAEWRRFERGLGNERLDPYCGYVREMWAAIGEPFDGRSLYANGEEVPWSAAFISWVVRRAGPAYAAFRFAASHSVFVNNAIKARVTDRKDKPFWGYRIDEAAPQLGDIIQRNRDGNRLSFSYAENHADYASHSDIVVEVKPDVVRVLGGNVGDTVGFGTRLQEYRLTESGHLAPDQGIIALLRNRAGLAE